MNDPSERRSAELPSTPASVRQSADPHRSSSHASSRGSEDAQPRSSERRGVREWLADLFTGEGDDLSELMSDLRQAAERRLIDEEALNMFFGGLHVGNMHARDIMIPRSALIMVQEDQEPEELLPIIIDSRHSRFPVVGNDVDDIKGILHAKDLLALVLHDEQQRFDIKDFIRPATVIPESKRLNVLLQEFRANKNHMAVVVDEYGQVAGAVTIEDVLEQIVGDIEDEHDVEDDSAVQQLEPHSFNVKATASIEDFNDYFATDISDDEFDTIGGVVLKAFGHLPEPGETVDFEGLHFEVLNADSRRLRLLRVQTPR